MKKECQVIMLPTNDITDIIVPTQGMGKGITHLRKYYGNADLNMGDKYQHLYIVSDDEIKEGDWCYDRLTGIFQYGVSPVELLDVSKKIIATIDKSLIPNGVTAYGKKLNLFTLPQIPESFLIEYCKNPVDKVLVEYDCDHNQMLNKVIDALKLNSDNTINISSIKEKMYSKKEVIDLICDAINDANESNNRNVSLNYQTWIEENLK